VFKNSVPRRIFGSKAEEVTEGWRILNNEEFNDTASAVCINIGPSGCALSKARMVLDSSNTGIVGSNPARGMDIYPLFSVLCLPFSVCTGIVMDRSPIQGLFPKCLNGFIVSGVNSD